MKPGVYPAAVTPMTPAGEIDYPSLARLLAWFESCGCTGAVLAGTNGEGPSLSAIEKRDLIREGAGLKGRLDLVLGIATPSIEEAVWLCKQAERAAAIGALTMPPAYFKEASEEGIERWFTELMNRSPLPIIAYNFPQRTAGITLTAELLARLAKHSNFAGVKDSSGSNENLTTYAEKLLPLGKKLYVGDEALLIQALQLGWTGTISGASNCLPLPISSIVGDWQDRRQESARSKHEVLLPAIKAIRSSPQPVSHKWVLAKTGVIGGASVRLPLLDASPEAGQTLLDIIEGVAGPLSAQPARKASATL